MNNYEIYRDMYKKAQYLMDMINHNLSVVFDGKVYNVYVAVGDEEKQLYFVDIEIGGTPEKYKRWYGLYSFDKLQKIFDKGFYC